MSKKQLTLCRARLKEAKKSEGATRRFASSENQTLSTEITQQNWPNVKKRFAAKKGKCGVAFAAYDIKKDALLHDYHSSLANDEEGWRRFI